MNQLFIPYELAVIAEEKGFNEGCLRYYHTDKSLRKTTEGWLNEACSAPLYQQIIDWFREKHKIIITIELDQTSYIKFAISIVKWKDVGDWENIQIPIEDWGLYRNYYEALNKAVEEAFKLI